MALTRSHAEDFLSSKNIDSDKRPVPYYHHDLPKGLTEEEVIVFARKAIRFDISLKNVDLFINENIKRVKSTTKKELAFLGFQSLDDYIIHTRKICKIQRDLIRHSKKYQEEIIKHEILPKYKALKAL